jgi:hypothetical protein
MDNKDAAEPEAKPESKNVEVKLETVPGGEGRAYAPTVTIEERIAKVLDPNASTEDRLDNAAAVLQFLKQHDRRSNMQFWAAIALSLVAIIIAIVLHWL